MSIAGKHIVISGGGSGVGAAMAEVFAKAGGKVSILGRRLEPLQEVAARTGALPVVCDVTDAGAVKAALETARETHGPVHVAVANAGAALSKPFAKMSAEELNSALSVNVLGVFNLWQAALPDMKAEGRGRMICVASTAGLKGYPYVAGYVAAKHAAVGLTKALARASSNPLSRMTTGVSTSGVGKSKPMETKRCRVEGFSFFRMFW